MDVVFAHLHFDLQGRFLPDFQFPDCFRGTKNAVADPVHVQNDESVADHVQNAAQFRYHTASPVRRFMRSAVTRIYEWHTAIASASFASAFNFSSAGNITRIIMAI